MLLLASGCNPALKAKSAVTAALDAFGGAEDLVLLAALRSRELSLLEVTNHACKLNAGLVGVSYINTFYVL